MCKLRTRKSKIIPAPFSIVRMRDQSSLESNVLEGGVLIQGVELRLRLPCVFFFPTLPPFQREDIEGTTAAMQQNKSQESIKCL